MVAFPPFRLDLTEQCLWKGEQPIALRRKPFAILAHLVANAKKLVTHDELIERVWAGQVVSESAVRTHVHELRHALGEGLIETVIGRGYRFTAELVDDAAAPGLPAQAAPAGRDAELAALRAAFAKAATGQRQLCFVTGDPGIGKTTLVDAFLGEVAPSAALRGACVEQFGAPEAYLAVLDLLGRLRDAPERIATLVRYAPSFSLLVPHLLSEAQEAEARRRTRANGDCAMAREILDALDAMAATQPMVLVLEDMQWSDLATIDLVSQYGQRRERAKLLVIVTVRGEAARSTAHPINSVMRSLVARAGAISIPLAPLGEAAIADVIARRFVDHALPAAFAAIVERITGGTPLFLVALLDDLVDRGMIAQRDGRWQLVVTLDDVAAHRPASMRQLIDIQLDRLTATEQRTLEAASIVGAEFATELVAAALGVSMEAVDDTCDDLARRSLFLRRDGTEEWPDGTLQTRYAVTHSLVQETCAERVPHARRQRQHRAIAERLEAGFLDRTSEIAHVIATHLDAAGMAGRALQYYVAAAERTARRFASADALRLYRSARAALLRSPPSKERDEAELRLLLGAEEMHRSGANVLSSYGMASAALRANPQLGSEPTEMFRRAVDLSRSVGDSPRACAALAYLAARQTTLADHAGARTTCDQLDVELARCTLDGPMLAFARGPRGVNLFWRGELERASTLLAELTMDDLACDARGPSRHVVLVCYLAATTFLLGDRDLALQRALRAVEIGQRSQDEYMLGSTLSNLAEMHFLRGDDIDEIERRAKEVLALPGAEKWHSSSEVLLGWIRAKRTGGLSIAEASGLVDIYRRRIASLPMGATWLAQFLIAALRAGGHEAMAREIADQAIAFARTHEELVAEPRLVQLRSEL